jgi:membrane protein DedA with SNARE-associated domain
VDTFLAHALARFTYLAIVSVLTAAGLGVPVSEDLTELLAGALAAKGVTSYWPTLLACYAGVLLGDMLIHRWGARLGPRAYAARLVQKALTPERQEKLRGHFARHGMLTVVVGRHTPGLRAPIFFLAGASGVPAWKFLLADALSAVVTVPLVVTLGYKFAEHLPEVRAKIHDVQWALFAAVAAAVAIYLLVRRRRSAARNRFRGCLRSGEGSEGRGPPLV